MRKYVVIVLIAFLSIGSFGCSSMSKKEKGALIGGASGAILGGLLGKKAGNTAVGAIAGAAVGGAAGAIIGDYMDKQAEEMEEIDDLTVERVGEGIALTMGSGILFDVNKSELRPEVQDNLVKLCDILNEYPDTDLIIEGHTDSDGTEAYNQTLSERRANSVKVFLVKNNVTGARLTTVGYGEMQPIADNATAEGKQMNRRVHIIVTANDELRERAEAQAAQG